MKKQHSLLTLLGASALLAIGCGVEEIGNNTGGLGGAGGTGGTGGNTSTGGAAGAAGAAGAGGSIECPAGVSVVLSDYLSTQIALSSLSGETQSESLISTSSSTTDGLAFALSGDVALPSSAPASGEVVLLDRYGTNVITWVNPQSGAVRTQLPVGTGFESNPQDYVEVSDTHAWISRWGQNANQGDQEFDAGDDLLLINLSTNKIEKSVPMPTADTLPARPGPLSLVGDELFVTLDRIAGDFSSTGEAMIVSVDPETGDENFKQTLTGRKACSGVTASPSGDRLLVVCTGALDAAGDIENISQSAVIVFDASKRPLEEVAVFEATDILNLPLQDQAAFVDEDRVLLRTQTPWGGDTNNELFALDLRDGSTQKLLEANDDGMGAGKGLVYGGAYCAPGCSDYCLMPDSDTGKLQRILIGDDGSLSLDTAITVETTVGLPPSSLTGRN